MCCGKCTRHMGIWVSGLIARELQWTYPESRAAKLETQQTHMLAQQGSWEQWVYKQIALFALCQSKHIAPGHTESQLLSMRVCQNAVHVLKARGDIITGLGANKRAAVDYQCAEVCPAGCCSFGCGIFLPLKVPQTSPCHLRRNVCTVCFPWLAWLMPASPIAVFSVDTWQGNTIGLGAFK